MSYRGEPVRTGLGGEVRERPERLRSGPVRSVAGMLLASGAVQRTGAPMALVEHEGMRLVERGLRTLVAGGCAPVIVVLGCAAQTVRETANLKGAVVIINRDWRDGLGSSLRTGLNALEPTLVDGVCFLLNETPGVTAAAVRRINALGAD